MDANPSWHDRFVIRCRTNKKSVPLWEIIEFHVRAGTRSGAPIAGAWSAINHLGEEGYLRLTLRVVDATACLRSGITAIEGLRISFDPDLSLFEFGSDTVDMNAVCDVMDDRGWNLDRQPGGLHMMVSPGHDRVVDEFLADLASAVARHGDASGGDPVYGGVVI